MRLGELHVVTADDHVERVESDRLDDPRGHPVHRHRHQGSGNLGALEVGEQLAGAGPPWHRDRHLLEHAVSHPLDDGVGGHVDAARLEDDRGVPQAHPDYLEAVLVGPGASEGGDQFGLGDHPVRLGVDEGAIHVPENGGRSRVSHNGPS